jgi:hypothetical protein
MKLLMVAFLNKLECLPRSTTRTLAGKARADQNRAPFTGLSSNGWLPALLPNIRLGWKRQTLANTLAYYDAGKITAVKGFIVYARDAPPQ